MIVLHSSITIAANMSTVDLLISLPESLACILLSQWIDIEHLYKVDTAYCHKAKSKALHAICNSPQLLLSNKAYISFEKPLPKNFIFWCVCRQLKFWEFYLTGVFAFASEEHDYMNYMNVLHFLSITGVFLKRFDCHANACPAGWLRGLANHACQLEFLYFNSSMECNLINSQGVGILITRNQHTLKDLTLKITLEHPIPPVLSETFPTQMVSPDFRFPQLTNLELSVALRAGGILNVEGMIRNSPNLQHLTMHMPYQFVGATTSIIPALRVLRELPHQVKTITVHNLDVESAALLPTVCPTGPALELHFADHITSQAFRACVSGCKNITLISTQIQGGLDSITNCVDTLKTLSLRRGIEFEAFDLATLVQRCTVLHTLSIVNLHQLSSTDLETIARAVPSSVRVLTMYNMDINDYVLMAIAETAPQLTELHIGSGEDNDEPFTEIGLLHIAQRCTQLTALDLGRDPETVLGSMALYLWQKLCPNLCIYNNAEAYEEELDPEDDMVIGF